MEAYCYCRGKGSPDICLDQHALWQERRLNQSLHNHDLVRGDPSIA